MENGNNNDYVFSKYEPIIVENENENDYAPAGTNNNNHSLSELFESAYITESTNIINDILDADYSSDESDSDESHDSSESVCSRIKSLDFQRIKNFDITIPVDNLVTTLIFNITRSNERDISHLYSVGNTKSPHSSGILIKLLLINLINF
jgi:hypothetical protein